jgi:hypothetical protein
MAKPRSCRTLFTCVCGSCVALRNSERAAGLRITSALGKAQAMPYALGVRTVSGKARFVHACLFAMLTAFTSLSSFAMLTDTAHARGNGRARVVQRRVAQHKTKTTKASAKAKQPKRIRTPKLRVARLKWKLTEEGNYSLGVAYQVEAALLFRLHDAQAARGLLRGPNEHYTRADVPSDCTRDPSCSPHLVRQMLQVTDSVTRRIEATRLIQNIGSLQLVAGVRFSKDGEALPLPSTSDVILHLNPTLERGGYVLSARFSL